jgi:hypothetical protein
MSWKGQQRSWRETFRPWRKKDLKFVLTITEGNTCSPKVGSGLSVVLS